MGYFLRIIFLSRHSLNSSMLISMRMKQAIKKNYTFGDAYKNGGKQ